ncbi:chemotaxis protein [Bacillus sp. XF8]|uniref:lipase family protein n=1 Tax=Bacillus sp. XF8 TaxID=2819289 RepID=UPI001AA04C80|nr:chemotaxis protein [Bacillus sp. XF8]MBO1581678.1 chemotaxis protein [Bacillus sp. XF8]
MQKIAVAIIHGIGNQDHDFAKEMERALRENFVEKIRGKTIDPSVQLVIAPVYWADVFEEREERLIECLVLNEELRYKSLRQFIVRFFGDAIAYQLTKFGNDNYEEVHKRVRKSLKSLMEEAGETAPLCIIGHSLGAVIASNYMYDLQQENENVQKYLNELTPLEKGETFTLFYSLGTTIPLWSLRYVDFDQPIQVPSSKAKYYFPKVEGEWINFYDKDDILGYPLKLISPEYDEVVTEDQEVNVGSMMTSWNPLCHSAYLVDRNVINSISDGIVRVWINVNEV